MRSDRNALQDLEFEAASNEKIFVAGGEKTFE
jgi:hypothetical protein